MNSALPPLIAGIDPGNTGAIALLILPRRDHAHFEIFDIIDMPQKSGPSGRKQIDVKALAEELSMFAKSIRFAVIEQVHSMPGQGIASTFSFGRSTGQLEGLIAASFIPFFSVSPQAWKKAFKLTSSKTESLELAVKLFPDDVTRFSRVKDHNRAEAALLAAYGAVYLREEWDALKDTIPE